MKIAPLLFALGLAACHRQPPEPLKVWLPNVRCPTQWCAVWRLSWRVTEFVQGVPSYRPGEDYPSATICVANPDGLSEDGLLLAVNPDDAYQVAVALNAGCYHLGMQVYGDHNAVNTAPGGTAVVK